MMTPVQRMYGDHKEVLDFLREQNQVSHHAALQTTLPKVLLLAAASEFEEKVCESLREHVRAHILDSKILELVNQRAINRQYHTYFEWDSKTKTASKFWALFGSDFKSNMKRHCQEDSNLTESIEAFIEVGSLRNYIVHNNYAIATLEKTLDEIYHLYQRGRYFVDELSRLLELNFDQ
ncbi:HEPN domain-containing protein [Microbispora rosea]|uniref:HEPN domain-containing protein n=1 Tax=Microbispora rosea TaxID=58117 RepID=UPI0012DC6B19|nr:HEPN domain-containing protein [Microbispora rosea]